MSTNDPEGTIRITARQRGEDPGGPGSPGRAGRHGHRPFFLHAEFLVMALIALLVLLAAAIADGFGAERAWTLVTVLAAAYVVSRGLAKFGRQDSDGF